MIDPDDFDIHTVMGLLLPSRWHRQCTIKPHGGGWNVYWDDPDTKDRRVGLRYSKGPGQNYFWDIYADNMLTPELALIALSKAPHPNHWHVHETERAWPRNYPDPKK